jgi:hypothetical protein
MVIAAKVVPVPFSAMLRSTNRRYCNSEPDDVAWLGRMAARPRPMPHRSAASLVGPTGARTEIRMSPASAIFKGVSHHFRGVGLRGSRKRPHYVDIVGVTGSIPVAPTIFSTGYEVARRGYALIGIISESNGANSRHLDSR